MNRRDILRYASLVTGATVSAPLASAILSGCSPSGTETADYKPQFFLPKEMQFLRTLVDTILPETDSPSASAVGVHQTIDSMATTVYFPDQQDTFREKFREMAYNLNFGRAFAERSESEREEALQKLESSTENNRQAAREGLMEIKQQTVSYYLATGDIAKKFLNYLPVPGTYDACIPLADVDGKAWAE